MELSQLEVTKVINAPADNVWNMIREFSGVERFLPWVASSCTHGKGVGATRTVVFKDGHQLLTRLETLDEQECTLSYSIVESTLPVENYLATIQVKKVEADQCEVGWTMRCAFKDFSEEEKEKELKRIEGLLLLAIEELEKLNCHVH